MIVYLNGEFLPLEQAHISPLDRGFLFGDGVYEVIPVYDGKTFLLEEHLTRLKRSLNAVDIKDPLSHTQWVDLVHTLSTHAPTPTHGIYLQITRGVAPTRQHQYPEDLKPTVFAMTTKIRLLSAEEQQTGLSAITAPDVRWKHCYIKSLNLLPNVLAMQQGFLQNACEVILINEGYVTEGCSSNVFIVKDNVLITPAKTLGILWGITRDFVLGLAREQNITFVEANISELDLQQADEIWITSSGREIVPITRLNDQVVGDGKVGLMWKKLQASYQKIRDAGTLK